MMELLFLGLNGSCQDPGGGNTSLLIRGAEGALGVDLSCNLAHMVDAEPDAIVLTHEHIDHVYGLPSFLHQSWLRGRQKPLRLYVPRGMSGLPEQMLSLFGLREKKGIFEISLSEADRFCVGSLRVQTFPTDHTATSMGLVVEEAQAQLVYTSDTRPIPTLPFSPDVLIHEASGLAEAEEVLVRKGHSSGLDAGRLAAALSPERLFLCHLPQNGKQAILEEARREFSRTYLPELLMWYPLK